MRTPKKIATIGGPYREGYTQHNVYSTFVRAIDPINNGFTVYEYDPARCTNIDGIVSDNPYHPEIPAWFAQPEQSVLTRPQDTTRLSSVASYYGVEREYLVGLLCSKNIRLRAEAYAMIGNYHGLLNLDQYPQRFSNRWQKISG